MEHPVGSRSTCTIGARDGMMGYLGCKDSAQRAAVGANWTRGDRQVANAGAVSSSVGTREEPARSCGYSPNRSTMCYPLIMPHFCSPVNGDGRAAHRHFMPKVARCYAHRLSSRLVFIQAISALSPPFTNVSPTAGQNGILRDVYHQATRHKASTLGQAAVASASSGYRRCSAHHCPTFVHGRPRPPAERPDVASPHVACALASSHARHAAALVRRRDTTTSD